MQSLKSKLLGVVIAGAVLLSQTANVSAVSKKDVSVKKYEIPDGVVVAYKNNTKETIEIKGSCKFYKKGGVIIGDKSTTYCLGAGNTYYAHYKSYLDGYIKYKSTYSVAKSDFKSRVKDVKVTAAKKAFGSGRQLKVKVKQLKGGKLQYVRIGVLYYDKSKKIVGMAERYVHLDKKGDTSTYVVDALEKFSTCKAIVNYAY